MKMTPTPTSPGLPDLKELLNRKKRDFRDGDEERSKGTHRRKLDNKLQANKVRGVWSGMKNIMVLRPSVTRLGETQWVQW